MIWGKIIGDLGFTKKLGVITSVNDSNLIYNLLFGKKDLDGKERKRKEICYFRCLVPIFFF